MILLRALHTDGRLVDPAEHLQGHVVIPAQVTVGEGGRIRQPVSLQARTPQVRREVSFTIRRLTHEARPDRRRLVSGTDVTANLFGLRVPFDVLLLSWRERPRPFKVFNDFSKLPVDPEVRAVSERLLAEGTLGAVPGVPEAIDTVQAEVVSTREGDRFGVDVQTDAATELLVQWNRVHLCEWRTIL